MADNQVAIARMTRGTSGSLSKTTRQTVPPFLQKLYEMVSDSATDNLIRWSENGDSFFVLDHERVAHDVLPRWFKHSNFASFVRQLNMYGFHKIPHLQQGVLKSDTETEIWNFEHPNFRRAQPDLLCLITRKKQAQERQTDDMPLSEKDGTMPGLVSGGFSPGTMVDINSIINGIAAIKRHQATISADLNDLKTSNQHLWQEALDARERHQKQQDTINRILKFLAGVFGSAGTHKGSPVHASPHAHAGIPRKRQRLMIEGGAQSAKDKPLEPLDGVEPMDETETDASTPTARFVEVSPSPVPSKTTSIVPDTTDAQMPIQQFPPQPPMIADIVMGGNFSNQSPFLPFSNALPPNADHSTVQPSYPRPSEANPQTALTSNQSSGPSQELLQSIVNSPGSLQRLLNLLNLQQQQQNIPMPPPLDLNDSRTDDPNGYIGVDDPYSQSQPLYQQQRQQQQLQQLQPASDSTVTMPSSFDIAEPDSQTMSLLHTDDMPLGISFEPFIENANRLQKTSDASAVITDHVNMMDSNIESLIKHLGLDPEQLENLRDDEEFGPGEADSDELFAHDQQVDSAAQNGRTSTSAVSSDPSTGTDTLAPGDSNASNTVSFQPTISDFDFNVFLNELAKHNNDIPSSGTTAFGDYKTSNNFDNLTDKPPDPSISPRLSAFVDEIASQSGQSDISSPPMTRAGLPNGPTPSPIAAASSELKKARKRKSDIDQPSTTAHPQTKAKRKR